jgi:hypothetical protein
MDNMKRRYTKGEVSSIEHINFGVKWLSKVKAKDIERYQDEILKIGGIFLIPHLHKLFNLAIQQGLPKPWTEILILIIFKGGDKINPFNYRTIMISPILAKTYGSILERRLEHG